MLDHTTPCGDHLIRNKRAFCDYSVWQWMFEVCCCLWRGGQVGWESEAIWRLESFRQGCHCLLGPGKAQRPDTGWLNVNMHICDAKNYVTQHITILQYVYWAVPNNCIIDTLRLHHCLWWCSPVAWLMPLACKYHFGNDFEANPW